MKIAIDANDLTFKSNNGIKTYVRKIINQLSVIDKENEYDLYSSGNIKILELRGLDNFNLKIINSSFLWTYTKFPRAVIADKPDVLFMPIQAVPFFSKPKSIKIVVTIHDLAFLLFPDHFTQKDRFLLNFHTKRAVKMADKIIVPSNTTKKDLIKFYPKNENKIHVIYHGVSIHSEEYISRCDSNNPDQIEIEKYKPYLLFVGTIQPRKNIIRLIEGFELIKNKSDSAHYLKLVICGKKGWMYNEIIKRAKTSKFSDHIILTGNVSDSYLEKLYKNAFVFVFPSLYEGFGLPVLEAMSYGVPCIVGDNSSLREISNSSALLIKEYSPGDMSEKIGLFLNNKGLREDFSRKSLKNVKRFDWNNSAQKTLAVFKKAMIE